MNRLSYWTVSRWVLQMGTGICGVAQSVEGTGLPVDDIRKGMCVVRDDVTGQLDILE